MPSVFISHSSANNAEALALRDWLVGQGWDDLFLDIDPKRGIVAGDRWLKALADAGGRAKAVLFLITPQWLESQYCRAEFFSAAEKNKLLLGVIGVETDWSQIPPEMAAVWQVADLTKGSAFAHFPVSAPPEYKLSKVRFSQEGLASLYQGLRKTGLGSLATKSFPWPAPGFETEADGTPRTPWRGLEAIDEPDAGVFFGRDGDLHRAMDKLAELRSSGGRKMLVILGASGSGKSSFLRAGLLPRLKRLDREYHVLRLIRPERAVINGSQGLLSAVEQSLKAVGLAAVRATLRKELEAESGVLSRHLSDIQNAAAKGGPDDEKAPTLILPLDQAEELFAPEAVESDAFLAALSETLRHGPETIVIATIRTDSYEPLQRSPAVRDQQAAFSLPPIGRGEYRAAIEGPASRLAEAGRDLIIYPTLMDRLVSEAEGADALPLLAFTLERLYREHGGDGEIGEADYEDLGGMRGAVEAAVDVAFAQPDQNPCVPADPAERLKLLRRAFPWLVGINEANASALRRVAPWDKIPAEARPLIERLINQRLLRSDLDESGNRVVEIAHEALLRQWPTLQTWLDGEMDNLRVVQGVERAAAAWQENGQSQAWLDHRAERLTSAEALAAKRPDLSARWGEPGQAYLGACRVAENAEADAERERINQLLEEQRRRAEAEREAADRRARQVRLAWSFSAVALVLMLLAGWQFFEARRSATEAEARLAEAQRRQSLFLAQKAGEAADRQEYTKALLIALEGIPDSSRGIERPIVPEVVTQLERSLRRTPVRGAFPHAKPVNAARISPDGTLVATASADGSAAIWQIASGTEVTRLTGHKGPVWSVTFSPDSRYALTAGTDRTARLWKIESGAAFAVFEEHKGPVWSAVFSPDGKFALTASTDQTARIWDVAAGTEVALFEGHAGPVWSGGFSPDGRLALTASADGTARIWDAETGALVAVLDGHDGPVWSAAFSPDGTRVATASADRTARLWNAATGTEIAVLTGHEDDVKTAVFSPDGKLVVTASYDGTARVWDVESQSEKHILRGHSDWIRSAAFALDGSLVVTASEDGTLRLWNPYSGEQRAVYKGHQAAIRSVAVSFDGQFIVTASEDNTARLWAAEAGNALQLHPRDGYLPRARFAGFSPDGSRVITSYSSNAEGDRALNPDYVGIWDSRTGGQVAALGGNGESLVSAAFSPDGAHVIAAYNTGTVRVWNAASSAVVAVLGGREDKVWRPCLSPDGSRVAGVSSNNTARIWDTRTGKELAKMVGHRDLIESIAFSPSGDRVVTASNDGTARIWNSRTGANIRVLEGHQGDVTSAVFSPDGSRVATGSWGAPRVVGSTADTDHTARIWDAETGEQIAAFSGHNANVYSVAFSPDGAYALTASADNTARIWDSATGTEAIVLRGHSAAVGSAMFSPDGAQVLTASADGTARLWDRATGAAIAVLEGSTVSTGINLSQGEGPPGVFAAFAPSGDRILTAGYTTPTVWEAYATVQQLVDAARTRLPRCLTAEERTELHLGISGDAQEPDPLSCMNETAARPQAIARVEPAGGPEAQQDAAGLFSRLPSEFPDQLEAIREDGTVAAFISTADGLHFRPESSCVSDRTNLLVAKLRIFLSDIPHFRDHRNVWAVRPLTKVLSSYLDSHGKWNFGDADIGIWFGLFRRGFPSIFRNDVSLVIDELRRYHRMITATPEWRAKLRDIGTRLAREEPYNYFGKPLQAMFHEAGFPESGQPCAQAAVTSVKPGFSNEDVRVSNEGWLYSFWSRRLMDGQFETTKNLLDVLSLTISY